MFERTGISQIRGEALRGGRSADRPPSATKSLPPPVSQRFFPLQKRGLHRLLLIRRVGGSLSNRPVTAAGLRPTTTESRMEVLKDWNSALWVVLLATVNVSRIIDVCQPLNSQRVTPRANWGTFLRISMAARVLSFLGPSHPGS